MFTVCDLADWELSWEVELTLIAIPTLRALPAQAY